MVQKVYLRQTEQKSHKRKGQHPSVGNFSFAKAQFAHARPDSRHTSGVFKNFTSLTWLDGKSLKWNVEIKFCTTSMHGTSNGPFQRTVMLCVNTRRWSKCMQSDRIFFCLPFRPENCFMRQSLANMQTSVFLSYNHEYFHNAVVINISCILIKVIFKNLKGLGCGCCGVSWEGRKNRRDGFTSAGSVTHSG